MLANLCGYVKGKNKNKIFGDGVGVGWRCGRWKTTGFSGGVFLGPGFWN